MNEAAEMGSQFPAILLFALWWGLLLALDIVFPRADPPPPGPAVQHVSGADAGAEDGADADAAAWQAVAKADPAFDGAAFLRGAATAYEAILCAFAQEERETLRRLLSAEVLAAFEAKIAERRAHGGTLSLTFVGMRQARIVAGTVTSGIAEVSVRFAAEILLSVTQPPSPQAAGVEAAPAEAMRIVETRDLWTFARALDSRDPNWQLIATDEAT